jgi:hypothetical protein
MKVWVSTQYIENYGDAEKPYWKPKGGCWYEINFPFQVRKWDGLAYVQSILQSMYSPVSAMEYVTSAQLEKPELEEWDEVIEVDSQESHYDVEISEKDATPPF